MSETRAAFEKLKKYYLSLDGADRALFLVHFAVSPTIILAALILAFGWIPVTLFAIGFLMWIGSEA